MNKLFILAFILIVPAKLFAQQTTSPQDNVPDASSSATSILTYPYLYNYSYSDVRNYIRTYLPSYPTTNVSAINSTPIANSTSSYVTTNYYDGLGATC